MSNEIKSTLLKLAGYFVLIIFQGSSFCFLWFYYYVPLLQELNRGFYYWGDIAVIAMYLMLIIVLTKNFDGYKFGILRNKNICLSNLLAIVCGNFASNILVWMIGIYYFSIIPMILLTLIQWGFLIFLISTMRYVNMKIVRADKILVIYDKYSPEELIEKASGIQDKLLIKKTLNVNREKDIIIDEIKHYEAILMYDLDSEARNQFLKLCYNHKKKVYLTPKISDIIISGAEELPFFDTPLLRVRGSGLSIELRIIKRIFDIILSLTAIVVSSPLLLIFAIIVKLHDGGKVFYTQERLTENGKAFKIIKFRSMREDSEQGGAQLALSDDDRITPIGKFMRATHLDELPQMFNILKGEMSLVGPRPEQREIIEEYEKSIPEFSYRLAVKAGLTGYAQIYGKYNTIPYDKLRLDLRYIEKYSLILDIKILFLTFKVMFQRENTEGIQEGQRTAMKKGKGTDCKDEKRI